MWGFIYFWFPIRSANWKNVNILVELNISKPDKSDTDLTIMGNDIFFELLELFPWFSIIWTRNLDEMW